jgi:hypothetical protein
MKLRSFALAATFILLSFATAFAQNKKSVVFADNSGAIRGYDPVAYFTDHQPVKGEKDITFNWHEAVWHFATTAHRDSFAFHPDRYAPQYGGYCAYGWAQGYPAKIEPEAWSMVDGKLYLNYDLSVQRRWNKKQADYIKDADKNWPGY